MNRRKFLAALAATSVSSGLMSCSENFDSERYTQVDKDLLAAQREQEALQSGKGRFGRHHYSGYKGLAKLPWFDLDSNGLLICTDDTIPRAIDVHCHLGMSVLFKPRLDLLADSSRVEHLLDCDDLSAPCDLDLDVYANTNFDEAALSKLRWTMLEQGLWGSSVARTQTIPNLVREMQAMRVEKAVLLPIKLDLPFGDDLTEQWQTQVNHSGFSDQLHVGCSVHPDSENNLSELRDYASKGHKVLKLHPTVQKFFPDDPALMEIYALAEELGMVVFFHGGRAGIEPESSHPYAMPRHYEAAFADFPKLRFIIGHAGARDNEAMLKIALKYSNVWIDIHGQGISQLDSMIQVTQGQRLLFGSDWPFYHLGSSLAKVLICTQNASDENIRRAILRDNALQLFESELFSSV